MAPFVSLFSGDSTGGRERRSEGFLRAKSTETHEDVKSIDENKNITKHEHKIVWKNLESKNNTKFKIM